MFDNNKTMLKVKDYKTNELVDLIDDSLQQVRSSFANKKIDPETKMAPKATETTMAITTPSVSNKRSLLSFQDVQSDESYTSTKLGRKMDRKSRSKMNKMKKRKESRKKRKEKKKNEQKIIGNEKNPGVKSAGNLEFL